MQNLNLYYFTYSSHWTWRKYCQYLLYLHNYAKKSKCLNETYHMTNSLLSKWQLLTNFVLHNPDETQAEFFSF